MKQMVSVLSCLQEMNIAHRDIKPQNIVKHNNVYKIIDLDVGRCFEDQVQKQALNKPKPTQEMLALLAQSIVGTEEFMAPERTNAREANKHIIRTDPYRGDVYSLGIVLLQLCYCDFEKLNKKQMSQQKILQKLKAITDMGFSKEL